MEKINKISGVISTLTGLFADKDQLIGFADWDAFIGCVIELKNVKNMLIAEENVAMAKRKTEEENNGEL